MLWYVQRFLRNIYEHVMELDISGVIVSGKTKIKIGKMFLQLCYKTVTSLLNIRRFT